MQNKKILVAEDDAMMVSLLNTLLGMEGYEVIALQPDANVLEAVRVEHPDVILLDVHLTHQSGLEILDDLRNSPDANGVKVVMSSGANVKEECIRRGANGFLSKPYMPDDLIAILRQAIQSA
jgi:CheY-like chemotaxis protein